MPTELVCSSVPGLWCEVSCCVVTDGLERRGPLSTAAASVPSVAMGYSQIMN